MTSPAGDAAAACGWFGKLAALGDFTTRRLPGAFVRRCDDWLSAGLAASRAELGERWLATYLQAPLWRFAWAPGLAGPTWWTGLLMPSVDRVGRYFPLVVARPVARLVWDDAATLAALHAWYAAAGAAMLETLAPDAAVERFDARLHAAPPAPPVPRGHGGANRLAGHSLWSAGDEPRAAEDFHVADGLPAPACFAAMLQGRWT